MATLEVAKRLASDSFNELRITKPESQNTGQTK
ncbi:Uncharacterised protein [Vibrio cholerae]|nr:Uncharacterised protein [Vibrio cholerae]